MTPINILKISYISIVLLSIVLILLTGAFSLLTPQLTFGVQKASASSQYGILGRQAPELGLNTWIDGDGKPMDPVRLKDYRGKVIFLYFFQDW